MSRSIQISEFFLSQMLMAPARHWRGCTSRLPYAKVEPVSRVSTRSFRRYDSHDWRAPRVPGRSARAERHSSSRGRPSAIGFAQFRHRRAGLTIIEESVCNGSRHPYRRGMRNISFLTSAVLCSHSHTRHFLEVYFKETGFGQNRAHTQFPTRSRGILVSAPDRRLPMTTAFVS
jgi:hypothetical protein